VAVGQGVSGDGESLEENVDYLIRDVRAALSNRNWYAAVALALMLPDACSAIDQPWVRGRQRYYEWTDRYVAHYFSDVDGQRFLTGRELYLIRCAFLHAGELALEDPAPTAVDDGAAMFEVLNRVHLFVSDEGFIAARGVASTSGHEPIRSTNYSVDVDQFCDAICQGAIDWLVRARADALKRERIAAAPRIIRIGPDGARTPV
jgi:hypothetical protein